MPNWCKGNIRVRGSVDNIKRFLKEGIELAGVQRGIDENISLPPIISDEEHETFGEYIVGFPEKLLDKEKGLLWPAFYIKGTRRNFIESKTIEFFYEKDRLPDTLVIDEFAAAWDIDAKPYEEMAKEYGLDIKIIGYEKGMMFKREIEIIGGEVKKNEETGYRTANDWYWNAEQPNWGG